SGRGVGMDVVRANIERIGGIVDIDSKPGHGLRLTLRVPLTLTIIPALTISVGGQHYAIPRSAIEEIVRSRGGNIRIEELGGARIATIRDKRILLIALADALAVSSRAVEGERNMVVLKPAGGDVYALAIDTVHDHEELVVKPAAPAVMTAGLYAGTTLADDGRPILLLDPSGMATKAGFQFEEQEAARHAVAEPAAGSDGPRDTSLLLFRGLDGGLRAVPVPVVERIEDVPVESIRFSAGKLRVSVGGLILPLAGCTAAPSEGKLRILRLTDGDAEMAYGFADVVDIRALALDLKPAPAPGEVAGVALIDGGQVEVLDPYWLFAAFADGATKSDDPLVCALPQGDPWMDNMLRPLIESLGYRVVAAGEGVSADILIASADEDEPQGQTVAGEVLRIRSRPELGGENDNSIYRYDRAALLNALSRGAANKTGSKNV
ncbi:MAG: chemotaxis protein CheW, partial [Allosphingosinicella sp.]